MALFIDRFWDDRDGSTAVDWLVFAAGLALLVISVVGLAVGQTA